MELQDKKLGVLISARPDHPNFRHGIKLADSALKQGLAVYVYCLDDAVAGVVDPELQGLRQLGLHLYACAYSAQKRNIETGELATFGGLGLLSDMIAGTDRFVAFN